MDLSTDYMGLKLAHPFVPGASPLADDLDTVRRLEDAGAPAIVMRSLFEEQLSMEQMAIHRYTDFSRESFAEATSFFPEPESFRLGPDEYLEQLRRIKAAVKLPVIASLNGVTLSGWLDHAKLLEAAGADALELNVYSVAADTTTASIDYESRTVELVKALRRLVKIPFAVKLSPFYTSLPYFCRRLEEAGADGFVLFNRLFEPDIDLEALEVKRVLHLSDNSELPLRLRWVAILSPQLQRPIAISGGVHSAEDATRALMVGAQCVQLVSALLEHGPEHLAKVKRDFTQWLEAHEYSSLSQLRGSMSLKSCPDPAAYVRANYMLLLQSWQSAAHESR